MDIGHSREGGPESEGEGRSFIQGHSTPGAGEARKNKSHLELFGLFFSPNTTEYCQYYQQRSTNQHYLSLSYCSRRYVREAVFKVTKQISL